MVSVSGAPSTIGVLTSSPCIVNVNGPGSKWANSATLYVGQYANATLNVTGGATVTSSGPAYIAYSSIVTAVANVSGPGSTWTNTGTLYVDYAGGNGTLNVTSGASVASDSVYVGYFTGTGTLNITSGASVTSGSVTVGGGSLLALDVGQNSKLTVGAGGGTLTNSGTIRIAAAAADAAGVYTPIAAGTWSGSGVLQALGGTWNAVNHTFTVASAKTGTAGLGTSIDLSNTQRIITIDPSTGLAVGASFQPSVTSSTLTFTATTMSAGTLAGLQSVITDGTTIRAGWQFTAGSA